MWIERGKTPFLLLCAVEGSSPGARGFPHEAATQNIWRTSAIKRQECSKLGMGPGCPSQAQTVTHTHTHSLCLVPELCQPLGWVFAVGTPCPGVFGVCRWGPSQAHFWGTLNDETEQELELTAPVICHWHPPKTQQFQRFYSPLCWEFKEIPTSPAAATSLSHMDLVVGWGNGQKIGV